MADERMTAEQMEAWVRERWERVDDSGYTVAAGPTKPSGADTWIFHGSLHRWELAYEFTIAREEEIRQVEEEVEWMTLNGGISPPAKRILTARQVALEELRKGMKA